MVTHLREDRDQHGAGGSPPLVGAILHHRTNPCEVDYWRPCHDLSAMLRHEASEVIYGSDEQEIESEIWKRHPVEGDGVTLVTKAYGDWDIERTPRLLAADLGLLHQACALHKRVLVGNNLMDLLGGVESLTRQGFLVQERSSRSARLVRYNPHQVRLNRWKQDVQEISQFLKPEFPPALVERLFEAVSPENWPKNHPFSGRLESQGQVISEDHWSGWGRHSCRRQRPAQTNCSDAPQTILTFIQIARRLGKGGHSRPWRQTHDWKDLLGELVQYLRGVERTGSDDWKKLARWVRSEARAAKVKIPPAKKLPPRPSRARRTRRRRRSLPSSSLEAAG